MHINAKAAQLRPACIALAGPMLIGFFAAQADNQLTVTRLQKLDQGAVRA